MIYLLKVYLYIFSTSKADEYYHFLLLKMFLCRKNRGFSEPLTVSANLNDSAWLSLLCSWSVWVISKMCLEDTIPSVHSIHLIGEISLTRAVTEISLSPFSESSSDLFDTFFWDSFVVSFRCTKNVIKRDQVTSSSA